MPAEESNHDYSLKTRKLLIIGTPKWIKSTKTPTTGTFLEHGALNLSSLEFTFHIAPRPATAGSSCDTAVPGSEGLSAATHSLRGTPAPGVVVDNLDVVVGVPPSIGHHLRISASLAPTPSPATPPRLSPLYLARRSSEPLAAGEGGAAVAEFQKILDHSGIVWNCYASPRMIDR